MPSSNSLALFAAAALVLLVIPGPAVFYIVARSASQGRRAGMASVAGIHTGTIAHVLAAVFGLSAMLAASATAFATVKLAGAAYLCHLGVRTLLRTRTHSGTSRTAPPQQRLRRIYADGVVVNVLNPKTAVFFLAFVPQFVDVTAGNATTQLLVFGALFIVLGVLSDGAYAIAGSWIGRHMADDPVLTRRKDLASGTTYIGLGLAAAMSGGTAAQN